MLVILFAASALVADLADDAPTIRAGDDPTRVEVEARLKEEEAKTLPLGKVDQSVGERWLTLALDDDGKAGPAIFGSYQRQGETLKFKPRYGLLPGQMYRATVHRPGKKPLVRHYQVPQKAPSERPEVDHIYPSGDVLPANQLKFYIYFSRPMREGLAIFDLIQIVGEDGEPIPDPWRRTELWTQDSRRFTIWIHPGRVKQGVNLREEEGPVLVPGKRYKLVIDGAVRAADGAALGKPFVKEFRTIAEDHRRPLPQDWKLTAPRAGTCEPLTLNFGRPLDYAMLHRFITVQDADGKPIMGDISVGESEASWKFVPNQSWHRGEYRLRVNELLEDLAGNTPNRVFDKDLTKPDGPPAQLALPFRPKK